MKRFYINILFVVLACISFGGCNKFDNDFPDNLNRENLITPYCKLESNSLGAYVSGIMGTKALVNADTPVEDMLGNFLVIDQNSYNLDEYITNWSESYISESIISTIPDPDNKLRTISLQPERPYTTSNQDYTSRMVGWYPRTYNLPEISDDKYTITKFKDCGNTYVLDGENKTVSVKFTGLDGSKDVMVSDIREASFNNPFNTINSFTFKHYLSAVRVFAKAENSSQDLGLWGDITKVVVINQPSSCEINLPQTVNKWSDSTEVIWGTENVKNSLIKSAIFGEKDINNPENLVAEDTVKISGSLVDKYLGYSLIKPNSQLWLQVHTKAGVYEVKLDPEIEGNSVFNAGYIYDIHLNFKADGTISAFLLNEGSSKFYDLTTGRIYSSDDASTFQYHYSNCYIINSNSSESYDGFCFDATIVGNGEAGVLSFGAQSFYPENVHISPRSVGLLWETSPDLISQIELLFGYVRFKVAKKSGTYKEGNAVIAVYGEDGSILWSWHIWITDTPQDLTYTEGTTKITVLDRNLGATAAKWEGSDQSSGSLLETYGLYYQWGRKDPSMGPPSADYHPINMITAPYYDYASTKKDAAEVLRLAEPTLRDAVENPMYLIMPTGLTQTYYFNWLYEKIDFLWGYDRESGTNSHKTIYDPCPYGYKVSGGELGDLFAYAKTINNAYTYSDNGQIITLNSNDFYFPYTGYKGVDRGLNSLVSSWKYVGEKADYQSAVVSVYTADKDYYMHRGRNYLSKENAWSEVNVGDYTGHQIEDHTNRRTAAPVRCVKNENHNRVSAFITPDKYTIASGSDDVTFTLYAQSFGGNISSVTLTVGYHLAGHTGTSDHKDYVLYDSKNDGTFAATSKTWGKNFTFNFNSAPFNTDETNIDAGKTTGDFRFVLQVKTTDNINKISSTTIVLAKNTVDFSVDNWDANEVLVGQPVNKQFRIFGDSRPQQVEMEIYDPSGTPVSTVDITSALRPVDGSSYTFDYLCSTAGLSFATKGWNNVVFKVTFESGEILTTEAKYFKVGGLVAVPITSKNQLNTTDYYLIQNQLSLGYVYDAGAKLKTSASYDYSNLFRLDGSNGAFKVINVLTSAYPIVDAWANNIDVKTTTTGSERDICTFDYSSEHFTISMSPRYGASKYWRFYSTYSDYIHPFSDAKDNTKWWNIYRVTYDYEGIPASPTVP